MPKTLTLNAVRSVRPVVFSAPDANGNSTATLYYTVTSHSTVTSTVNGVATTTDVFQDVVQATNGGVVTVPISPTDTTLTVMENLQSAALQAEGLSAAAGDRLFLT